MKAAYIALGSNMGDRLDNLKRSLELLSSGKGIFVTAVSAVYETEPVGGPEQDLYLNACASLATDLPPTSLLLKMLDIETGMGRTRDQQWGPRIIDLDLLVYEGITMKSPLLELPHPRLADRDFVLIPLAGIAPNLVIPGRNRKVREILSRRDPAKGVRLYKPSGWHSTVRKPGLTDRNFD